MSKDRQIVADLRKLIERMITEVELLQSDAQRRIEVAITSEDMLGWTTQRDRLAAIMRTLGVELLATKPSRRIVRGALAGVVVAGLAVRAVLGVGADIVQVLDRIDPLSQQIEVHLNQLDDVRPAMVAAGASGVGQAFNASVRTTSFPSSLPADYDVLSSAAAPTPPAVADTINATLDNVVSDARGTAGPAPANVAS